MTTLSVEEIYVIARRTDPSRREEAKRIIEKSKKPIYAFWLAVEFPEEREWAEGVIEKGGDDQIHLAYRMMDELGSSPFWWQKIRERQPGYSELV